MIGAIIGDIAGSRFEFHNIKTKDFEFLADDCYFTDDTVMTIAVAKAVSLCAPDRSDLAELTIRCMQEIGRHYPGCGYGGRFIRWMFGDDPQPYNSCGNGSAMRVSACGFAARSLQDALDMAEITASVTHNHPEGIKGAQAAAAAIWLARNGKSMKEIRAYIEENFYPIDFTLEQIRPTYIHGAETCQASMPQALEGFFEATGYEDTIRNCISIGGDCDTTSAIAGGIAQAYYGVPADLRNRALTYLTPELRDTLLAAEQRIGILRKKSCLRRL